MARIKYVCPHCGSDKGATRGYSEQEHGTAFVTFTGPNDYDIEDREAEDCDSFEWSDSEWSCENCNETFDEAISSDEYEERQAEVHKCIYCSEKIGEDDDHHVDTDDDWWCDKHMRFGELYDEEAAADGVGDAYSRAKARWEAEKEQGVENMAILPAANDGEGRPRYNGEIIEPDGTTRPMEGNAMYGPDLRKAIGETWQYVYLTDHRVLFHTGYGERNPVATQYAKMFIREGYTSPNEIKGRTIICDQNIYGSLTADT